MIDIKNISFSYGDNVNTLSDINLAIVSGEIVGITGESGCGKTTLAKLICGFLSPQNGEILFELNKKTKNRVSPIQILFQNNENLINPKRIVKNILGDFKLDLIDREYLFNLIGITDKIMSRRGLELSGGERQKVGLARIMLANPKVLILDEPFSAQDISANKNFIELFKDIHKSYSTTIIAISHDLFSLKEFCSRLVVMKKGAIVEDNITEEIFNRPQEQYTQYLIKSASFLDNK